MHPPIYLINLDDSLDRLNESKKRLEKQHIMFQRIEAVLGTNLSDDELSHHYDQTLNDQTYYRSLKKGEIGCYLSHRKAWKAIAEGHHYYGIVLEDDFEIIGDLNATFQAIDNVSHSWGIMKLAGCHRKSHSLKRKIMWRYPGINNMELVIHYKPMIGFAATAITKKAAQQLLNASKKFARPVDVDIQCFWEKKVDVVALLPFVFEQNTHSKTTIKGRGVKQKKNFWKRKWQQLKIYQRNKQAIKQQVAQFKKAMPL
jgi:glycosyl transferase family 25